MEDEGKSGPGIISWVNDLMGSSKLLIGVLAIGIIVGFGGNRLIGSFVDSQTDNRFEKITDRQDRFETETKERFGIDEKLLADHQIKLDQITELKIELAVIQAQISSVSAQIADVRKVLESGAYHRRTSGDPVDPDTTPVVATDKR